MTDQAPSGKFAFPKWSNLLLPAIVVSAVGAPAYFGLLVPLIGSPTTLNVGYQPIQPVEYSHQLHVGELGIDCRYCHTTVEDHAFAAIPPTATCMACHHGIHTNSAKLEPVFRSYYPYLDAQTGKPTADKGAEDKPNPPNPDRGKPVQWVKVHDLPDYSYFNHSVHVAAGVSCVECHGRVDRMDEAGVYTVENLSMSWCVECHREPARHLRPRREVTNLGWGLELTAADIALLDGYEGIDADELELEVGKPLTRKQKQAVGIALAKAHRIKAAHVLTSCSTCHR